MRAISSLHTPLHPDLFCNDTFIISSVNLQFKEHCETPVSKAETIVSRPKIAQKSKRALKNHFLREDELGGNR